MYEPKHEQAPVIAQNSLNWSTSWPDSNPIQPISYRGWAKKSNYINES